MLRSTKMSSPWMAVARKPRFFAWCCLLLASCLWTGLAHASCPTQSATVAPLGTVSIDVSSCSKFGTSGIVLQPLHGTAGPQGGGSSTFVTYANTDGSATSDKFSFIDDSGSTVLVNITIGLGAPPSIILTPTSLATGSVGTSYSQQITASGGNGGPYTYTGQSGSLPAGMTLQSNGLISGTPTEGGSFPLIIAASDGTNVGTQSYTLVINGGLTVSPASLPGAFLNSPYSQTITASGGTGSYSYAVDLTYGPLPSGLSLSSGGVLSGTPTATGNYGFTIKVTDNGTGIAEQVNYSLAVTNPPPVANAVSATVAYGSTNNPITLNITGGAPVSVAVASAPSHGTAVASGMSVTYTPTSSYAGSDSFTYTATNAGGTSSPATVTITVSPPTMTYAPTNPPTATVGTAYSQSVAGATGGSAPYTYAIASGSLPPGVSLASNGTLSGTPTGGGNYTFTVKATDSSTGSGPFNATSGSLTLTVGAPTITIAPASLPNPTVGVAYSQSETASGGTGSYAYSVAGSLPPGLAVSNTGVISGTPTSTGTYTFDITATDSSTGSGPYNGSHTYTLTVAPPTITLSPGSLLSPTVGVAYSQTITASEGVPATFTYNVSSGSLPAGLSLGGSTGVLSGTPTASGAFSFTITATDGNGITGSQAYSGTVVAGTVVLAAGALPNATAEAPYSHAFNASGGTTPYTYSLTAGSLPAGLALSSSGVLSGTPTAAGTFNFTIKATDNSTGSGAPFSASQAFTLTVAGPTLTVSPSSLPTGTGGVAYSHTISANGGSGGYTFSLSAGALPPGIAVSSAGLVSGTPTTAGSYTFTVTATDGFGFTGSQAYTFIVQSPSISVTPVVLPVGTGSTAYSQALSASGGNGGYTYSLVAGALPPGIALSSAGQISGTPTAAGSFNFTIKVIDGFGFSGTQAYTFAVNAPTIAFTRSTLPGGQVAVAYSQTTGATGGSGSYTYSLTAGALPPGIALSSSGALSGTPTAAGNYSFTVTATDSLGFTGSQAYSVGINQPLPVVANDTATTPANSPATIAVTGNDTGPITSIAVAQAPVHGSATVSGFNVVFTPNTNYFGTDSFTYTATGPGGTSAPATVSVTVTPLAIPVAAAQSVSVLAGKSVTIHATQGATGAPFTTVAIVNAPATGTASVSGTDIVYTAPINASGTVGLDYTLSNPFGASQPAHVTVTVNPMPLPAALSASVVAGRTVQVDLTRTAHGGPFTAATLIAVSPANAGSASVHGTASGYALDFMADSAFSGQAQVSYTLSNAYATSAVATVTISVTGRSDPSKDAEVLGVLAAQADSARRLALGQIDNFQRRLETLHSGAASGGFTNGISLSSASARQNRDPMLGLRGRDDEWSRRYIVQPDEPSTVGGAPGSGKLGEWSVWTGGAVNFGKTLPGTSDNGIDFTTSGISMGVDRAFDDVFALGAGVGYGHDASDIGHHDSRSTVDGYSAAVYGSYRPAPLVYVDALVGYQWMSFDARRYVTDNGNTVHGSRDGTQLFASLSVGYEHRTQDDILVSPYGRFDFARASLDSYTEHGDEIYALRYESQTVKTSTGVLGLRAQWVAKRDYGVWMPQLRAEFRHDFQGSSVAAMRYADLLGGPLYSASLGGTSRNHTLVGAGVMLQTLSGWSLRAEYQNLLDNSTRDNQSVQLGVEKKFDP